MAMIVETHLRPSSARAPERLIHAFLCPDMAHGLGHQWCTRHVEMSWRASHHHTTQLYGALQQDNDRSYRFAALLRPLHGKPAESHRMCCIVLLSYDLGRLVYRALRLTVADPSAPPTMAESLLITASAVGSPSPVRLRVADRDA